MNKKFVDENAEVLYEEIIAINKRIVFDKNQESLGEFGIINEGSLINLCNSVYTTKPFTDDYYYNTIEELISYVIFHLNKGHCFLDGNKRTTFGTVKYLLESLEIDILDDEFFQGVFALFLVEMLELKNTEEEVLNWVKKQFNSKM
ncbi:Fic family protein [Cetobacterium sp.]|uniref:Fic family protein n=1 Tax=Cetobacterium sp. TaxID=2071632 RepID=UPI003F3F78F3